MDRQIYDYKKAFFHRPRWTLDNVVFGKILTITAIVCFTITALLMTIFRFQSGNSLQSSTSKAYISRLATLYQDQTQPLIASNSLDVSRFIQVAPREETTTGLLPASTQKLSKPRRQADPDNRSGLRSAVKPRKPLSIDDAIGQIALPKNYTKGLEKTTALAGYRSQARDYQRNTRPDSKPSKKVTIPGANHTDFNIITGYREYETTLAVATQNRQLLQHCIDAYYNTYGNIQGYVIVRFDVHPNGYTIPGSVNVIKSTLPDPRISQCMTRNIRRWRNFDSIPIEFGIYTMTQKYVF